MPIQDITSINDLYFSWHMENDGVLCLYTPNGAYRLNVSAAERLSKNFDLNLRILQDYTENQKSAKLKKDFK